MNNESILQLKHEMLNNQVLFDNELELNYKNFFGKRK